MSKILLHLHILYGTRGDSHAAGLGGLRTLDGLERYSRNAQSIMIINIKYSKDLLSRDLRPLNVETSEERCLALRSRGNSDPECRDHPLFIGFDMVLRRPAEVACNFR
jgi:hypothetical protein